MSLESFQRKMVQLCSQPINMHLIQFIPLPSCRYSGIWSRMSSPCLVLNGTIEVFYLLYLFSTPLIDYHVPEQNSVLLLITFWNLVQHVWVTTRQPPLFLFLSFVFLSDFTEETGSIAPTTQFWKYLDSHTNLDPGSTWFYTMCLLQEPLTWQFFPSNPASRISVSPPSSSSLSD